MLNRFHSTHPTHVMHPDSLLSPAEMYQLNDMVTYSHSNARGDRLVEGNQRARISVFSCLRIRHPCICGLMVVRAQPFWDAGYHNKVRMDFFAWLPPWMTINVRDLDLRQSEHLAHLSYGASTGMCVCVYVCRRRDVTVHILSTQALTVVSKKMFSKIGVSDHEHYLYAGIGGFIIDSHNTKHPKQKGLCIFFLYFFESLQTCCWRNSLQTKV